MSVFKYFLRLQYIDFLISRKATGDQGLFARKNHLSKRGLAKVLEEMKEMGFPIKYDRNKKTYCYTKKGKMTPKLFIEAEQVLSADDLKVKGMADLHNLCFSETSIFEPCENI